MSCTASLAYNIHDVYEKRREAEEKAKVEEAKPLLEVEDGKNDMGSTGNQSDKDNIELEHREDDWTVQDAYWVGLGCCVVGVVIYAYAVVWHLK
jgi:hypothetical protein